MFLCALTALIIMILTLRHLVIKESVESVFSSDENYRYKFYRDLGGQWPTQPNETSNIQGPVSK